MDCESCTKALTEHAVGGPLAAGARDHLEGCASCRARLEGARRAARDIDDELRRALALQPSPGFVARIRERVAAASDGARWRRWWPALAFGGAAVAVLIAVQVARQELPRPGPVETPRQAAGGPDLQLPVSQPPVAPLTVSLPGGEVSNAPRPAARRRAVPGREPEVLVPPGQREAIRRFAANLDAGLIGVPPMLAQSGEPITPIEIAPIELKPIVIPPVQLSERLGAGDNRQRYGP